MGRLCDEYIELLSGDGDPSEKFWQLDKRIRSDKRNPGVQIEMTRTNFIYNIISLISNDVISMKDLEDFSDELKETVRKPTRQRKAGQSHSPPHRNGQVASNGCRFWSSSFRSWRLI